MWRVDLKQIASLGGDVLRQAREYARLMRLDRPVGIWLLLWPTLWALWIAGEGRPDATIFSVMVLGVIVMRSAGCVINDFADRHFDPHVARTAGRPLAHGTITPSETLALFATLGLIAVALVLQLNPLTRLLAVIGALLTVVYPFSKRFVSAPQVVLGAAFGWGIPMAFAAETASVPRVAWVWWLTNLVWAVTYDTIYAMADREDDRRIGVRSTAILFGSADVFLIGLLQAVLLVGLVLAGRSSGLGAWYLGGVAVGALLLLQQHRMIRDRQPDDCIRAFLANQVFGATIFTGILLDLTFRAPA